MTDSIQYITNDGERWDTIAFTVYGNPNLANDIIRANPQVNITDKLTAGTVLNIPVKDEVDVLDSATTLPPWKK